METFELIKIGKTVSTHGIKGELKVISDFEYIAKAYQVNRRIMLNNELHKITSVRYHKNYILITIDDLDNINNVLEYVGFNVYMVKDDLNLDDDEYLYVDLINAEVVEDKKSLGKIIDIVRGSPNDYIKVKGLKEFLIPLIPVYVEKFDKDKKIIYTKDAKNLII